MNAIQTKYLGPSNVRGPRVKAAASDGDRSPPSITLGWDHALSSEENHLQACRALIRKMGWAGKWVAGSTREGYVFVRYGACEVSL